MDLKRGVFVIRIIEMVCRDSRLFGSRFTFSVQVSGGR
jgi:hypothetical protein